MLVRCAPAVLTKFYSYTNNIEMVKTSRTHIGTYRKCYGSGNSIKIGILVVICNIILYRTNKILLKVLFEEQSVIFEK